ncbi:MAG: repair protein RecN [Halanaerobiales bacterium]|nr:repair protein RecN [Halanaerobiales bacterium]
MLVDFRVKNFALIDELEINFKKGLNILTGETGAGKSIIIGALEILLGARASADLIRKGKERAYIEAVFEPVKLKEINQYLESVGIEADSSFLLLSREIRLNGRNRSRINGQLATASMIKDISKYLVDIHGQHEHQSLLDPKLHLKLLDEFIGFQYSELKERVTTFFQEISTIKNRLAELQVDEAEKARQIDLLEFQIDEIEKARLQENEIEELYNEYRVLTNLEEIYATTGTIYNALSGDDYESSGIVAQIGSFMREMENIKDYAPELKNIFTGIRDVYYQLEDLGFQLRNYHDKLEFNQERLDKIENRLNLINALQRKYGETIAEILKYQSTMQKKLDDLKTRDKLIAELNQKLKSLTDKYYNLAKKLSAIRQKKAKELEQRISAELKDLAMKDTVFKINFSEKAPAADGIDQVEFLISTNLGEELKPLARIASGGELSRIMLALKTIIAHIDQVDTLVFDEVDSGVGGKTAQLMAEKLALIGKQRQVLCITHLPQIASMADNHLLISKEREDGQTFTSIYPLNSQGKKKELARMLGGVKLTETTLKHAEEMLALAENKKSRL